MACDACYRRKVRCDLDNGPPCLACLSSGAECSFQLAEEHKARRRARKIKQPPRSSVKSQAATTPWRATSVSFPAADEKSPSRQDQLGRSTSQGRDGRPQAIVPTEADMVEDTLAKTALTRFYHHSVNKSNWEIFHEKGFIRIAYIGNPIANLAQIVNEEAYFSGNESSTLHLPFPAIRPTLPWKPTPTMPLIKWHSQSFAGDLSSLPSKDVRDDLIDSFFEKVHPGFPVVDEFAFRTAYSDLTNPPPLLLFQAVLLAGAHVSQHPNIVSSRSFVKMVLFRRAKALFDLRYENDRMHMVQAALLFTWHFEGADDVSSNAYCWAGIACRTAFGLGMHRNLSADALSLMPVDDRRIYRRIWWTVFQIEVLASLHHGRPSMIDLDEIDQPPLSEDDLIEQNGIRNAKIDLDFCVQNSNLCIIILSVMKLSSPGAVQRYRSAPDQFTIAQANLDQRLVSWYLRLPAHLTNTSNPTFWALQLQIHYNLALLKLHRLSRTLFPTLKGIQETNSSTTCHRAASSISKIFDGIVSIDRLNSCWFTGLTALLAITIQVSHEARTAARDGVAVLAIQAQNELERILPVISALSHYWSSAEAILRLYEDLLVQFKRQSMSWADPPPVTHSPANSQGVHSDPNFVSWMDDNDSLGSAGAFGSDWQALFGAGLPSEAAELNFDSLDHSSYL
ncbi:hypothetical protein LTR10_018576 [Elasticomyces elasticus]|uniref:Zn(2)-C6 fungal-type domain-containing protein n=1 Tax=Exophiala sideris TaxID=1016849 RepID=A0ABR0JNQ8_9EURO|nr:hypothetical protein LTR10_018576 [Elasticomyces elasticus]KAK5038057.1 hypothetical protein LTS07_001525 [Exophiala sideris]KAK5044039.1 hypothetical protein LTR13_000395 [Exophiala sideris]KAK5067538.1 hypothetical protein LTR69_001527 [Exophiala sideris]KAK5184223.1 hypothetical protein LTR44_003729 [Eurotiomycetes sp. CCFEE 6388]